MNSKFNGTARNMYLNRNGFPNDEEFYDFRHTISLFLGNENNGCLSSPIPISIPYGFQVHEPYQQVTSGYPETWNQATNQSHVIDPRANPFEQQYRSIDEIPLTFRSIFDGIPHFNSVQSKVFNDVFYSGKSIVVSAPTGSGKTVILELSIVRMLVNTPESMLKQLKIVYMAPLKALVAEKYKDWTNKFQKFGLNCAEITGDTSNEEIDRCQRAQIFLTTPEKWDSLTRRWKEHGNLVKSVSLVLIDEVHVLNDEIRGPTLEAVVCRMKTIHAFNKNSKLRIIAVSATIPNLEDIATWLSVDAVHHNFEETHRPVQLQQIVLGYHCSDNWSEFRFDLSLNYQLASVIMRYSQEKPTLVFASTRKSTCLAATTLAKERMVRNPQQQQILNCVRNELKDQKLKECVIGGVGYHHAGLDVRDRRLLENLFIDGNLPVLVATSTLAMGVNLPAHLVIIKSTAQYVDGAYKEYSNTTLLQMIGRAGRPQFDTTATAVIMTKQKIKSKYEGLVGGKDYLESHLHEHLIEHLNAEIVLGTIQDLSIAVEWLRSTFFYVRVQKNPKFYGLPMQADDRRVIIKLQELCTKEINALAKYKLIDMGEIDVSPTRSGCLMARYYISFETMKTMISLKGEESLKELLQVVSSCKEFSDLKIRTSDKKLLNEMNKEHTRFKIKGRIKTTSDKINCLVQTFFSGAPISDFGLNQEVNKVFQTGQRLTKCLSEYCSTLLDYTLVMNSLVLAKCFSAKLWENSTFVSKQLDRIGPTLAGCLSNSNVHTFEDIETVDAGVLELICNRHAPFGTKLKEQVRHLPKYELTINQTGQIEMNNCYIELTVRIANKDALLMKTTTSRYHTVTVIASNSLNQIVFLQRIRDSTLLQNAFSRTFTNKRCGPEDQIKIDLISESWVGLDVASTFTPKYNGPSLHQPAKSYPNLCYGKHILEVENKDKRTCGHNCLDKSTCKHQCCKNGTEDHKAMQLIKSKGQSMPSMKLKNPKTNGSGTPKLLPKPTPIGRPTVTTAFPKADFTLIDSEDEFDIPDSVILQFQSSELTNKEKNDNNISWELDNSIDNDKLWAQFDDENVSVVKEFTNPVPVKPATVTQESQVFHHDLNRHKRNLPFVASHPMKPTVTFDNKRPRKEFASWASNRFQQISKPVADIKPSVTSAQTLASKLKSISSNFNPYPMIPRAVPVADVSSRYQRSDIMAPKPIKLPNPPMNKQTSNFESSASFDLFEGII